MIRDLRTMARAAPGAIAGSMGCSLLGVAATLLLPSATATTIDRALAGGAVGTALLILAGLLGVRVAADAASIVINARATSGIAARLRTRFAERFFARGLAGLRGHDVGDLVTRHTSNTAAGVRAVPSSVIMVVEALASAGGVVALFLTGWQLGLAFLLGVAPTVLLLRTLMRRVHGNYGDYLAHQAKIISRLGDALAGRRTIQAARTYDREIARVLAPLPDLARTGRLTWRIQQAISWQLDVVLSGLRLLVLAVAGLGLGAGWLSPGQFVAVSLYLGFALGFLSQADTLGYIAHAQANIARVTEVLRLPVPAAGRPGRVRLPAGPGQLNLDGVTVRHDGRAMLDAVDLAVPAGSTLAVVGASGAGKSTLALTCAGLLRPDSGTVRIDGVDLAELDHDGGRAAVALAFDRPVLLGATVGDVICYGHTDPAPGTAERAARLAAAHEFVERLPAGYRTPLLRAPLSGGERQRLGLARALARPGRVTILDDATSSLDTITESRVNAALDAALAGRTRISVTHRASDAARADRVAWLDAGRVRALGPHEQLWDRHAGYRAVFAGDPGGSR